MKKQYIEPLCEEIQIANRMSELQTISPAPVGNVYLPVAHGMTDITAE